MVRAPRGKGKTVTDVGTTRRRPPLTNEPPSNPPGLNATAAGIRAMLGFCFVRSIGAADCRLPNTFSKMCISIAEEQEAQAAAIEKAKPAQRLES
jgi:hypothetical protein